LTNAEVDKAKAIREIMKNGVVGEGATRIGVGNRMRSGRVSLSGAAVFTFL